MTEQPPAGTPVRLVLATVLLAACAAGGFLAYRAVHPPATLHPAPPAAAPRAPAPAPVAEAEPPPPKIPETLPLFALPGLDGRSHRLADWHGHPLVVNFWATWCDPCRREIPLLERLRHEHSKDALEIVGIAIDSQDPVQKYVKERRMDYPVLIGEDGGYEAMAAFGMEAVLPFSVFADGAGEIVGIKVGELHSAEAELVLARLADLAAGRLDLARARQEIAEGMTRLSADRAARDGAAH